MQGRYKKRRGQGAAERCPPRSNFEKCLIAADGEVVARFRPETQPDAPEVRTAIESLLGG